MSSSLDDIISGDTFDTRDLIELIEELEANNDPSDPDPDIVEELTRALALQDEIEGYAPDYRYGEQVIADRYFKEYAQEFADDIGAINGDASWPNSCIDWDWAARELQMDYTRFTFEGKDWWVR